jgi:ElaB/YqjD/DUF883 family membrane-anchored ribosome-binding protein
MEQAKAEAGRQEGLADQASARAQEAGSAVQEKASELREQGSARLRDQFDQRSSQAGSQMRSLAKALRRSGDELGSDGTGGTATQLTGKAADRIERLGGYLEQRGGDELMRDIETFARRRPWMLAGIGMLAGLAGARFMKASSEERSGEYRRMSSQWSNGPQVPVSPTTGAHAQGALQSGGGELRNESGALSDDQLARDPYAGAR